MINLTTPITRPNDTSASLVTIQVSYEASRVLLRVKLANTGEYDDFIVGPGGIDTIAGLVAAVPQFAGLRTALEQYLASKVGQLSGSVS